MKVVELNFSGIKSFCIEWLVSDFKMIFIFALSVMGIQGFRHPDHDNKPMGADDWSSELGDLGGLISS